MNAQSAGDVALMDASIKKPGRFESPPFQFIEIAFNAFWITHARGYHEKQDVSLYYANISITTTNLTAKVTVSRVVLESGKLADVSKQVTVAPAK